MQTHFFEMFDQIKPSEQDRFAQYLYSQHGADEQIVRIFKHISPLVKQGEKVNEAKAFEYIFGTAPDLAIPYAMRPLHNLFHDLKKELLDFFAWQEYRKNRSRGPALLLRLEALKKKGISALYTEQVLHCRKKSENKKRPTSVWDYLEDVLVEDHHLYNTLSDPWDKQAEQSLDEMISNLDQFYAAAAWKYRLERLHQIGIYGNAHRQSAQDMDALHNLTERLPQSGQPLGLYRDLYRMVSEQDADLCERIQDKYPLKELAPEEQFILTTTLANFKYRHQNSTPDSPRDLFFLYKNAVKKGIFTTGGFLPALIFQNVVTLACEEMRLELAEEFIQKHSSELPPAEQESARALALAKLSIAQKNYEKALSQLNKIEENSVAENLQCRLCKVRVLYELDKTEDLFKTLDNLTQYARRQHLKSVQLGDITGFVKVVRSLWQKEQKSKVQALFWQMTKPPLKAWLLEKIEQLP